MRLSVIVHPAVLLLAVFLVGCGGGSVVGRRYDNFTAYYNGFYNAERVYADGTRSLSESKGEVDRTRFMTLFNRPSGNTGSRDFESAIKKSADLLREHPNSKWVDDALLLIGKSYFFQENFVGAGQKFEEVISLDTKLGPEARFWLARTLITSGAYEEAQAVLTTALSLEDVDREYRALFHLAMGELNVKQGLWDQAADELGIGLEDVKDATIGARAQFLHGQVLETLNRHEEAVTAYRRVARFNPPYELRYAADYSAVRVQGLHLDPDAALVAVRRMERDDKNISYDAELTYLRARILQSTGADDAAFALYDDLLYDPNPSAGLAAIRGRVHFALAELYRDIDGDYVLAAAHFDTAATALGTRPGGARTGNAAQARPGFRESPAPEAIVEIESMRDSFRRFATVYNQIVRQDSLLELGTLPQDEYDARILDLRRKRAEEIAEQQRILAERQRDRQFQQQAGSTTSFQNQGLPPGKVIPGVNDGTTGNTAGFLYHEDPIRVQEGRATFREIWGNRPLVPNWRRSDAITGAVGEGGAARAAEEEAIENFDPETLPEIDTSGIPRDSTAQARMRAQRALSRYELGNTLFLNMSEPDSAIVWYRRVIDEDADQPVAQRALYALAEVQRALGDDESADMLYRQILDRYPASDFAGRVRERLGVESDEAMRPDSVMMAASAYERVYSRWGVEPDSIVLGSFLGVAAEWQPDESAARAMLAAARLHLEMADADSVKIVGPLNAVVQDSTLRALWPDRWPLPDTTASVDAVAVDSLAGESAVADSVVVAERVVPADSVAVAERVVPADSTRVPDAPADSVHAEPVQPPMPAPPPVVETPSVTLEDVYEWVRDGYRGTPFYEKADGHLSAYRSFMEPPKPVGPAGERVLTAADSLALAALRGNGRSVPRAQPPVVAAAADSVVSTEGDVSEEDVRILIPDAAFSQRADLRPLIDADSVRHEARGFFLVVGRSVPNVNGIRRTQQILTRSLMTDGGMVTVLATTGSAVREYQVAIGPFESREVAEAFYAERTQVIAGAVGIVELIEAP